MDCVVLVQSKFILNSCTLDDVTLKSDWCRGRGNMLLNALHLLCELSIKT